MKRFDHVSIIVRLGLTFPTDSTKKILKIQYFCENFKFAHLAVVYYNDCFVSFLWPMRNIRNNTKKSKLSPYNQ